MSSSTKRKQIDSSKIGQDRKKKCSVNGDTRGGSGSKSKTASEAFVTGRGFQNCGRENSERVSCSVVLIYCMYCKIKTTTLEPFEYITNGTLCMRGKCFECLHPKHKILRKVNRIPEVTGCRLYLPVCKAVVKKWFGKIVTKPNGASRCFFFCEWASNIRVYDLRSYFSEVQRSLISIDWSIYTNRCANRKVIKKHFIRPGFCSFDGRFFPSVKDIFDIDDMLCLSAVKIVDNALEFIFYTENPDVTDFVLKHMKQMDQLGDILRWCIEAVTGDALRVGTFEISYYSR